VITDDGYRFEKWQYIAERNFGFVSATIDESSPAVLRIRCRNGLSSYGYDYRITNDSIELVDEFAWDDDGVPAVAKDSATE